MLGSRYSRKKEVRWYQADLDHVFATFSAVLCVLLNKAGFRGELGQTIEINKASKIKNVKSVISFCHDVSSNTTPLTLFLG